MRGGFSGVSGVVVECALERGRLVERCLVFPVPVLVLALAGVLWMLWRWVGEGADLWAGRRWFAVGLGCG